MQSNRKLENKINAENISLLIYIVYIYIIFKIKFLNKKVLNRESCLVQMFSIA